MAALSCFFFEVISLDRILKWNLVYPITFITIGSGNFVISSDGYFLCAGDHYFQTI